ncbi:hypothetical protein EGJ27_16990 [Pseudomonas sp. v388]|uniref:hypothetical protein n=1 Tax=Pseudomonas sp. v388 TaxID=2479849 RepID=UPI000F7B5412|nr:hypothetical protein [Pseudomonas sp. v388]RRV06359.1 hypothetical protein EGJ27_16990 [Pseudomonas sp. v388]
MRWLFLLLLMLNAFYYIWHQQEAPLRAKEIVPLALQRSPGQDIKLLSESGSARPGQQAASECLYLGGIPQESDARAIEQRLNSLDVHTQFQEPPTASRQGYWLKVMPESRRLVEDGMVGQLAQDFPQLKSKIMSCEGIASAE